jgi:mono/diheme cytochrome c family protein
MMQRMSVVRLLLMPALAAAGMFAFAADTETTTSAQSDVPPHWGLLDQYCSECHNATDWAGEIAFDTMLPESIPEDAAIWEEAVRKLRGRLMPPPGKPQPDQATIDSFVAWMEGRLDAAAAKHPNPGHVGLHRLNRTEYAREIESLLGLKIDATALLPRDTESDGFDNVANVLRVSPTFLDQYIVAAQEVSLAAVGRSNPPPTSKVYRAPPSRQDTHMEGLPLGTRGGMLVEHLFPADGEYRFDIGNTGGSGGGYVAGLDGRHKIVMTLDGVKVFEAELGGEEDLKAVDQRQATAAQEIRERFRNIVLPVKAGPRKIGVAFVARTLVESEETLQPLGPPDAGGGPGRIPVITGLEIVGPINPSGITETPSRRKIFVCRPATESEELPCAKQILGTIARRAFRRPITDEDLKAPLRFYEKGRASGSFDAGIQQGIMAILASPKFLYRVEAVPANVKPGQIYRISDLELASRLSFFLWSQGPDEELLEIAGSGRLRDPQVLDRQVRRMLADPRSSALVSNFAYQWLAVDEIDGIDPDPAIFPEFDGALREAFRREILLFVDSILREDRSVIDLLSADHTFVNERLALHYGIKDVRGDRFRRVKLADANRWGLLGKGAVLMGTSYANRTSPVKRGAWIMENITGTPPTAPPPGVEALKENMEGVRPQTVRERMELHRAQPSCNSCHGILDPLGLVLENFDAIGAWRVKDRETATVIDADGDLHGRKLNGPQDLRNMLLERPEQFALTITQKLMTYALGRTVEYHDMPAVRAIVRNAATDNYRFSSIVAGIVKSDAFNSSILPEESESAPIPTSVTAQAK